MVFLSITFPERRFAHNFVIRNQLLHREAKGSKKILREAVISIVVDSGRSSLIALN